MVKMGHKDRLNFGILLIFFWNDEAIYILLDSRSESAQI